MDLRYINPFVASAVSVINEVVGLKATKKQIYIAKGKESQGGVSIFFNIKGDVEGQIIFDLPPGISTAIAQEMIGLHLDDVDKNLEQKDLLKSAITELGNMISGTAITKLEEHQYNCDITPPQVYVGPKARLTHPNMSTIVIEMNTNIGDFSINLVNKKDHFLENINILTIKTDNILTYELAYEFIPKGFYLYACKEIEPNGKYYLREKKIDFIFVDTDSYAQNLEASINALRDSSKNEKVKIIIMSSQKEPNFLKKVQELAVSGFILKTLNSSQLISKIHEILNRLGVKATERRKQITCKVDDNDKFKINIKIPTNNETIAATLTELGVGSANFTVDNKNILNSFAMHMVLKDIQLNLRGKYLLIDGTVSAVKDDEIAVRFTALKEKFVQILSEVVFEKISAF